MNAHERHIQREAIPRARPAARRKRDGQAARPVIRHIALPGYEIARAAPKPKETVAAFLRRTGWAKRHSELGWQFGNGLPTILEINGEAVLRRHWRRVRIADNDNVQFVSKPLGGQRGGGKQVLGLVALIAVTAFAFWAGPVLFPGISWAASAATAAIAAGGSLLISALTAPKSGGTNDPNAKQDQIYTASAQGNAARLGEPLPVPYGREKVFPDFAASPWGEFVGNDQYLNILLSMGMGTFDYEALTVDDTPLWNPTDGVLPAFSSAQVAFYAPGQTVALFPKNVATSAEVTGQQLPGGSGGGSLGDPAVPGAWIGGYIANGAGTLAQSLAIDFVFPAGCFTIDGDGNLQNGSAQIRAEYRTVNNAGTPTGSWMLLFEVTRTFNSRAPIRDSIKVDVAPARYEVRFRRNDPELADNTGTNALVWAGLRAFVQGDAAFADVSTVAIRIKASESTQGSFRFGAIRTRILPVWDDVVGAFVDQPTRSPGWAFLDVVMNAQYGAEHRLSKTDFNTVFNFAQGCASRGDCFDYTFTSAVTVPEALDKILAVARAKSFWLGDILSIVRDEKRDIPAMLLTDREIVRDSISIDFNLLTPDDPDAVEIEYIDEETWKPASVQYPPDDEEFTAAKCEPKRIDGILNRDHAYREAAFYYLQSIYRRESVQIQTEYEGRAITVGAVLRLQSSLPSTYGYGGAVIARAANILTLDPAPTWIDAEQHFIRLRRPNGKWFGPVKVSKGVDDAHAVIDAADRVLVQTQQGIILPNVLLRESGGEDPSFEVGTAGNQAKKCLVLSGRPNGDKCTLSLVVDNDLVHDTEISDPSIPPSGQFPRDASAPVIYLLSASFRQGYVEPRLDAWWFPAVGAIYYIAQISYDDGLSWTGVYEGQDNKLSVVVDAAAVKLRVQGVGARAGAFYVIDVDPPTLSLPPGSIGPAQLDPGISERVTGGYLKLKKTIEDAQRLLADLRADDEVGRWLDKKELRSELAAVFGEASARIVEVRKVAVGATQSIASIELLIAAQYANVFAQVNQEIFARSTANEAIAGQITTINTAVGANGSAIAAEVVSRTNGDSALAASIGTLSTTVGGHTSTLTTIQASVDGVSLQYGVTGVIDGVSGTFIFQGIRKLDGSVSFELLIDGEVVILGSIKAWHLDIITLSSLSANIGTVTAGMIKSTNNKMKIDLDNVKFTMSD